LRLRFGGAGFQDALSGQFDLRGWGRVTINLSSLLHVWFDEFADGEFAMARRAWIGELLF